MCQYMAYSIPVLLIVMDHSEISTTIIMMMTSTIMMQMMMVVVMMVTKKNKLMAMDETDCKSGDTIYVNIEYHEQTVLNLSS